MPIYPFIRDKTYTKNEIYSICAVPLRQQRGNWDTGYTKYNNEWFIFCNVGTSGRTGHDYNNHFDGEHLVWVGKLASKLKHDTIQNLIDPNSRIYLFYRESNNSPFTFAGLAKAVKYYDQQPVKIVWSFEHFANDDSNVIGEELIDAESYIEGATKTINVNAYERNPQARKKCLEVYGFDCSVCSLNFEKMYGSIGKQFIHVHHLKPLAEIGKEYELDPVKDLRPVCPNCHAMLHRKKPALSIEQLIEVWKANISDDSVL